MLTFYKSCLVLLKAMQCKYFPIFWGRRKIRFLILLDVYLGVHRKVISNSERQWGIIIYLFLAIYLSISEHWGFSPTLLFCSMKFWELKFTGFSVAGVRKRWFIWLLISQRQLWVANRKLKLGTHTFSQGKQLLYIISISGGLLTSLPQENKCVFKAFWESKISCWMDLRGMVLRRAIQGQVDLRGHGV